MPTTAAFKKQYRQLNERQREAVDAIDGPMMVTAGPGTGKTAILTLRIANILARTDTPPEAILALTFTESGAAEMKSRLAAIIGPDAYRVTVTTFHAFCNRIIQEYPESFASLAGAASLTEADQAVLIQELLDTVPGLVLLRPVNAPDLYLKAALSAIGTLKQEGVTPERLRTIVHNEKDRIASIDDLYHEQGPYAGKMKGAYEEQLKQNEKIAELAMLYDAYQSTLRKRRLYDYHDMIMEVAGALEHDAQLRLILQEQKQYILVDEHQDTNNAQNRVIELLASFWERPNLFVVGDAKQAIYRFQGASLENFLYFKSVYPDVRLITLDHNYRSSQLILDAAGTNLRAKAQHPDAPIQLLELSAPDVQYWTIAQQIQRQIHAGTPPEQIAVLARENNDLRSLAAFLDKLSIPYAVSSQQDALADPFLSQLIILLDALGAYGEAGPLYRALHAPALDVDPLDTYKLIVASGRDKNPYDVMRTMPAFKRVATQLSVWARAVLQPNAAEALETIVRESGILAAIVADDTAPESLAKLHALYGMLRTHIQRKRTLILAQFTEHLAFLRARNIPLTASVDGFLPGRVRLMTAHKSKGLEFDIVYLIDCTDGHWGTRTRRQLIKLPRAVFLKQNVRTTLPSDNDDEEFNLFYVALTRARREIIITMSRHAQDGSEQLPARYLADIRPTLVTRPDMKATEAAWKQQSAIRFEAAPPRQPQSADKAFLNDLFLRQGLSVTALNHYLACPWEYFYTSLLRIPEAPSFALMYGNAVDRALQDYFDRLVAGTRGTKKDLVHTFEQFVRHQPFQDMELQTALTRGKAALSGYYDQYHATWHPNVINQLRIPAVELDDGTLLNGKIDKVELLDASGRVTVVDYKTGKHKSRNQIIGAVKDGDGNYLRQLVFYKLLLDRWQNGKYRMSTGVIDFVEPDARGKLHRESFSITSAHVAELEAVIRRVAAEIRDLAFWDKRCSDRACPYCRLRNVMK